MDGLKQNLHFVVFGAGVLAGVILLFVGISMRGGSEESLTRALNSLQAENPPSEGDLAAAEELRERFDSSLDEAVKSLESRGRALIQGFDPNTGAGAFYTADANPTLTRLREQFEGMRKQPNLPDPLAGSYRFQDQTEDSEYFTERDSEMAEISDEQVRDYWIRLRIMEEVAAVCEALVEAGADDDMGVRLISFSFEAVGPIGTQDDLSPWMTMPWTLQIECSPRFATLLLSELTTPSELTMEGRRGFPNLLMAYQLHLKERPARAKFLVDNEYKRTLGHPEDLDPESSEGERLKEEMRETLEDETRIVQPVKVALQLRASIYNQQWRPMVEEEN